MEIEFLHFVWTSTHSLYWLCHCPKVIIEIKTNLFDTKIYSFFNSSILIHDKQCLTKNITYPKVSNPHSIYTQRWEKYHIQAHTQKNTKIKAHFYLLNHLSVKLSCCLSNQHVIVDLFLYPLCNFEWILDYAIFLLFFIPIQQYSSYFWDNAKKMTSTTRVNAQTQHTNKKWLEQ